MKEYTKKKRKKQLGQRNKVHVILNYVNELIDRNNVDTFLEL